MSRSIELNDDELRRLGTLAARTGQPVEELVHDAIASHLDELEDIAWAETSAAKWEASEKKTRPLSEVRREIGL
ncbi:DUF6290 family protein [Herbiconiux sp. UC225_62]|uniref:type II toxin-antitoxin system RelB family antitoxin n=1 Tax=Herbiconiux sp. UC225_62 TaxID=3350168 RepID=UPI0036D31828